MNKPSHLPQILLRLPEHEVEASANDEKDTDEDPEDDDEGGGGDDGRAGEALAGVDTVVARYKVDEFSEE